MVRRKSRSAAGALAPNVMARLDALSRLSSQSDGLTRLYLTPEHKAAAELVATWMREAGMTAGIDAAGTVVGRLEGSTVSGKTLLIGSHIDTVRNAGRFDGCLGVVTAIEAVGQLQRAGTRLPYAIEVLAFGDEEGVRFPCTLTGSHAVAGSFKPAALDAADADGISVRTALSAFGCAPEAIGKIARDQGSILGYVEVHIEQGPVLEAEKQPVGVVTAISGASRVQVAVTGVAGHAGTLPMPMRRDALTAAAEMILSIEATARATAGLVATVGQISASPGAVNVVPGVCQFTIDMRSPVDTTRRNGLRQIERDVKAIARRRQCTVQFTATYNENAAVCDRRFIRLFSDAIERAGFNATGLPSGAGHDGLALAGLCPIGMLFVRCKGGVSHHPDELVSPDDVDVATRVLIDFLQTLSASGRSID
jgi:allantoate deiminase